MKFLLKYLWLVILSLESAAFASSEHVYFLTEVTPPFYWVDNSGVAQGINVDLAEAMKPYLPMTSSLEHLPWARAYQETIDKPNYVLLTLLKTEKRENKFKWLGYIDCLEASLIKLKQNTSLKLSSLEDAKRFRIGTVRGYGAAQYLLQNGFVESENLVLVADPNQLWHLLFKGRIDFVLTNIKTGKYEIANAGYSADNVVTDFPITPLNAELQMATGNTTSRELTEALKRALLAIKENGEYDRIMQKWNFQ